MENGSMPNLKNSLQVSDKLAKQIVSDNQNHAKGIRSTAKTIDMLIESGFKWFNMVSPNTKGEVIGVGETKKNDNSFVNPMPAESFVALKMYIAKGLNPTYAYTLTRGAKSLTESQKTMKAVLNRNVSGRLSDYKKQLINRDNLLSGSNGKQEKKTFKESLVLSNNKLISKLKGMEDATLDIDKVISLLGQINTIVETKFSIKH
jgi:hypothetical protein|tara:strand:+ start:235 stop:846 length:612 start_codon:yes stop_codon:yes gene_type:complete